MGKEKNYLALDMGAESGRGMMGTLLDGKLELKEVHRFQTGATSLPTKYPQVAEQKNLSDRSYVWDFIRFWCDVKESIQQASKLARISSVGVDTWGVDFALLDRDGLLLSTPFHYRDERTDGMMDEAFARMPKETIYDITGIQFMQLNTIFQLLSMVVHDSQILKAADKFLMVPDLIHYWLTGKAVAEFTEATTTQIFDTRKGEWSQQIISAMGFPQHLFPQVVMPGTVLGPLRVSVAEELGSDMQVVAPPTHDTGCAVAAVPAENDDFIWISSGTWSIVGMNAPQPVINPESFHNNFTNEGGAVGNFRFSKNVMGLWLVQQCRRKWQKEGKDLSYTELTNLARKAPAFTTLVDPDYSGFLKVDDMIEQIHDYCALTEQPFPQTEGEMVRAILQGLALRYRFVIEQLEQMSGKHVSTIHIVGGGTQNTLLNQFTADATGKKVITGPIEATAIGNIVTQAIAMGDIADWQAGADVIRGSFPIEEYLPGDQQPWDEAHRRFKANAEKITLAF
jgi:rhamnulokinase